jgi:predicted DNA-binding WGR domain protein
MAKEIYHNTSENSNKFWAYEIDGKSVTITWGRVGLEGESQQKSFDSSYDLDAFVQKKIREKEKKGYKKITEQKLKKETKTADALGSQNKIQRMLWVSRKDKKLSQIDAYDPKQFVYVEILNSWSKKMTRLLLAKEETWMLDEGITESGRDLYMNGAQKLGYSNFADAVRNVLKEMAEVVAAALKTIKFAAVGARDLFGDGNSGPAPDYSEVLANIDSSGFDKSVMSKFCALGARSLDL